jgi:dihydrofolate synthase/folylpolyglutamate synthase
MPLGWMLEQLYARRRFGIRPGTDRVRLLLDRLGNPERSFRSIHVVGTNGKGSTSAFLSSILTSGGLRTALFTSPHLVRFSERFRIDGCEIAPERLEALLTSVLAAAPEEATFFEIVTALAALHFSLEGVGIAVMEAGMGGRSDATAALPGIMTVITPISLDHCDYLGRTLAEIATEKAGIAEAGTPVIIGRQPLEVRQAINALLPPDQAGPLWTDTAVASHWNSDGTLDYRGIRAGLEGLTPGMYGRYQAENAALALAAAECLDRSGIRLPESALRNGISAARWPGRMETVPGNPPLLLDGAHNPAGAAALAGALTDYRYGRLLIVVGTMADRNAEEFIYPLAPLATKWYCVTPAIDRARDAASLAAVISGLGSAAVVCGTVGSGIECAQRDAREGDLILVCGSLFTVGEAKAWLEGENFEGVRG